MTEHSVLGIKFLDFLKETAFAVDIRIRYADRVFNTIASWVNTFYKQFLWNVTN